MPNLMYTHPRRYGQGSRQCRRCGNHHALIRKYGLNVCRRCFREYANDIGFHKVCCCAMGRWMRLKRVGGL